MVEELAVGAELTAAIFVCLFLIPLRRKQLLPLIVSPLFRVGGSGTLKNLAEATAISELLLSLANGAASAGHSHGAGVCRRRRSSPVLFFGRTLEAASLAAVLIDIHGLTLLRGWCNEQLCKCDTEHACW